MYPTKAQFENLLHTRSLDWVLENHVFSGLPFSFANQPTLYQQMIDAISKGLQVPRGDICIVGSAKIGFSLSPDTFGRPFTDQSDLDIVVVSASLFDSGWINILTNNRTRWSLLRDSTRHSLELHRENHYIYNGWIRPEAIIEALDLGEAWLNTFNGLSRIPELSARNIGGRLYRTWNHARAYHKRGLSKIKRNLDRP